MSSFMGRAVKSVPFAAAERSIAFCPSSMRNLNAGLFPRSCDGALKADVHGRIQPSPAMAASGYCPPPVLTWLNGADATGGRWPAPGGGALDGFCGGGSHGR